MTHIVGIYEGYYDSLDRFMKFWDGKTYKNGNARVRPRIIVPIHFGINECGREDFLADLKSFTNLSGSNSSDGAKAKKKLFFMTDMIRKIFPSLKSIKKSFENVKSSDLRAKEGKKGNHFIGSFYALGEIKDRHNKDGREIVWLTGQWL